MVFNSIDFALFLPIVFLIYWFIGNKNLKLQNFFIVVASYFFYAWWDWKFLSLILFSSLVDYLVGLGLLNQENPIKRKILLWVSISVNLGFLAFFKYFNFFVENFEKAFTFFGKELNHNQLSIVLPVGISFYTFQTLSYSIDVYRKKLEPTKDFIVFSAFVTFFPQLVAGPIERATHLLPQFYKKRTFDYSKAVDGMRQILWGLFKKVVIADNCAEYANIIFDNSNEYSGSTLLLGSLFFAFQIYGDFSGYSDIAIGTSRLFGFDLMQNFNFPYFSRDIAEFWRKWHISLSTWFRDYLYIPLGGSKGGALIKIRNTFLIFLVSGFWHGANWTFIAWGAINAIYFLPLLITNNNRNHIGFIAQGKALPTFKELILMVNTFILTLLAWIFFRAENISHATSIFAKIFSTSALSIPYFKDGTLALPTLILVTLFIIVEWIGREGPYAIANIGTKWSRFYRHVLYYTILILIFWFGGKEQQFIYFQF